MADDPNTKKGRAKMLKDALKARRDVEEDSDPAEKNHHVETWSNCIEDIKNLQRRHGD